MLKINVPRSDTTPIKRWSSGVKQLNIFTNVRVSSDLELLGSNIKTCSSFRARNFCIKYR